MQVVNFTGLFLLVAKFQQTCQLHRVVTSLLEINIFATCHLQT